MTVTADPLTRLDVEIKDARPCCVRDRRRSWRCPTPATWRAYVECDLCGKRYASVCDDHLVWLREEMTSAYGGCPCISGRCDGAGEIVALLWAVRLI